MQNTFYFRAVIFFLIVPVLVSSVLVIPLFSSLPIWLKSYYDSLYLVGKTVFGNKESLWSFVGVMSAAIGILLSAYYQDQQRENRKREFILAFKEEIIANMECLFIDRVEMSFYFTSIEKLMNDYPDFIVDKTEFRKLRYLYDSLRYYREIVRIWRLYNLQAGDIVTDRQFEVCNDFIEYFEGSRLNISVPQSEISEGRKFQYMRGEAKKLKDCKLHRWESKLDINLDKIFGIQHLDPDVTS